VAQHPADLGVAAAAVDLFHQGGERCRLRHPPRSPAFAHAAEIDQLYVKAADRLRLQEHFALKLAGGIPGGLPAHGGVEGENQTASRAGRRCALDRTYALQERIDLGTR